MKLRTFMKSSSHLQPLAGSQNSENVESSSSAQERPEIPSPRVKLESNPDPSSGAIDKSRKKLTPLQRKQQTMFKLSGMKQGSLVKFLIKSDEDRKTSSASTSSAFSPHLQPSSKDNVNTVSNNLQAEAPPARFGSYKALKESRRLSVCQDESFNNEPTPEVSTESCSQDSDIELIGEFPPDRSENIEEIVLSENEGVDDGNLARNVDDSANTTNPDQHQTEILEVTLTVMENPEHENENLEVMAENNNNGGLWMEQKRRRLTPTDEASQEPNLVSASEECEREFLVSVNYTPGVEIGTEEQSSRCSTPTLKIVEVYTIPPDPCSANSTPKSHLSTPKSQASLNKVKKNILTTTQEMDTRDLDKAVLKNNWKRALEIMDEMVELGSKPKEALISTLIRCGILSEGSRVAKDIPKSCVDFLEKLIKRHPALNENGANSSVSYYTVIFQRVFGNTHSGGSEISRTTLYEFFWELKARVDADLKGKVHTESLRLLVLITNLVADQYRVYGSSKIKLKPSMLQRFLEEDNAPFRYNKYCQEMTNALFESTTYEVFCIMMKWVGLIARRLGEFEATRKEYQLMVTHVTKLCLDREDLGLSFFLNFNYGSLSRQVAELILLQKVKLAYVQDSTTRVSETDAIAFLRLIGTTKMIIPAITKPMLETCTAEPLLTYLSDRVTEENYSGDPKLKNTKGETRLHILCRPNYQVQNPMEEIRNFLQVHPDAVNAKDNFGNTAFHDCAKNNTGHVFVHVWTLYMKELINHPIDFLSYNNSMETPLHLAASYSSPRNVEILLHFMSGCSPQLLDEALMMPNADGKLPFEMAANEEIKRKLKPEGYNEQEMIVQNEVTLTLQGLQELKNSFSLKKVIAWWSRS